MLRFISPPLILLDIGRIGMKLHVVVAQQLLTLFFSPLSWHGQRTLWQIHFWQIKFWSGTVFSLNYQLRTRRNLLCFSLCRIVSGPIHRVIRPLYRQPSAFRWLWTPGNVKCICFCFPYRAKNMIYVSFLLPILHHYSLLLGLLHTHIAQSLLL